MICIILRRRKSRPITVDRLAMLTKTEPERVSNALQGLKGVGLAKRTKDGWCYAGRKR